MIDAISLDFLVLSHGGWSHRRRAKTHVRRNILQKAMERLRTVVEKSQIFSRRYSPVSAVELKQIYLYR